MRPKIYPKKPYVPHVMDIQTRELRIQDVMTRLADGEFAREFSHRSTQSNVTLRADEPLSRALAVMIRSDVDSILVSDARGGVIGVFTTSDALKLLMSLIQPAGVPNVRPLFNRGQPTITAYAS